MDNATVAYELFDYFQNLATKDNRKNMELDEIKAVLISNKNLIFTGSPGTGKKYLATELAEYEGGV